MTEEKKSIEVIFAPGCFDNFEGTQEELDELVAEIHKMVESGELMENATPVQMDNLSDEEVEDLIQHLNLLEDPDGEISTKRTLQ
jgi:hypothetical protein